MGSTVDRQLGKRSFVVGKQHWWMMEPMCASVLGQDKHVKINIIAGQIKLDTQSG
jgi:hypothetical protein